jgi:hypothetical protein
MRFFIDPAARSEPKALAQHRGGRRIFGTNMASKQVARVPGPMAVVYNKTGKRVTNPNQISSEITEDLHVETELKFAGKCRNAVQHFNLNFGWYLSVCYIPNSTLSR